LPRDIRCLIVGGFRARAAQPKQFTTAGNLRVASLAGVAAYLAFTASSFVNSYVGFGAIPGQWYAFGWQVAAVMLPLIAMALAWLSRSRLVVLGGALPAAAATCYAGPWQGLGVGSTVVGLACLAALVALAGYAERPSWRWLWPLGLLAIAPLAVAVTERFGLPVVLSSGVAISPSLILEALVLALGLLSIAWIVIDARPAIAMAVFLLAIQLPLTIGYLAIGDRSLVSPLFALIVIAITALAGWRLRRQSARGEPA
jgi:hypothetical protein